MMEQTYVVVGYFASRAAAQRALRLLDLGAYRHRLYQFGYAGLASTIETLALSWLRPGEWAITVHLPEPDARQLLDLIQRSGEAVQAAILSPALTEPDNRARAGILRDRWRWSVRQIQLVLKRQIEQSAGTDSLQQQAKWGLAEVAYEDVLAGVSLIEHRYIIEGYVERIGALMKGKALDKLPKGEVDGRPAPLIYQIARETDERLHGDLSERRLRHWLRAHCEKLNLSRSEFKTLEPMLVVSLMEDLAVQVAIERRREAEVRLARLAALRVGEMPSGDLPAYLEYLGRIMPNPSPSMAVLLLELLRDVPEHQAGLAHAWNLPTGESLTRRLRRVQQADAERLERFNRVITSLRALVRTDWESLIEDVSPVVGLMRQDPSGYFPRMDSPTRSWYLDRVADIAKWSKRPEREIADAVVQVASTHEGVAEHIGYHLVDEGARAFERSVGSRPPLRIRRANYARHHAAGWYLGWVAAVTASATVAAGLLAAWLAPAAPLMWIVVAALAALPLSQVAVEAVADGTNRLVRPRMLPKLRFLGQLPSDYRTLVVVPTILRHEASVRANLENLEVRYLANPDANLAFGLLTAFGDAAVEHLATDEHLIELASAGIHDLQQRHPRGHFFLYHRPRVFVPNEGIWMEEERKRGKLEEFNALILGGGLPDRLLAGELSYIRSARFVITLDEDTELPPGTALRLIEAFAHPLNEPQLDTASRRLIRGYGIIQPRVSTGLENGRASRLAQLLNGRLGIDPYMVTYSDLYYDLAADGIFHGKGIYDPRVFASLVADRLPAGRILSHDLLEGSYMRVALATDIMFFDQFPSNHRSLLARSHRWVRGDWQIGAWASSRIPTLGDGTEPSPFAPLSRWKITDNLRRSLFPVLAAGLLLVGLLVPGPLGQLAAGLALLTVFSTVLMHLRAAAAATMRLRSFGWVDLLRGLAESCYRLMMLPRQAWLSLDAIIRVWFRLHVSHRHLLQWLTAEDTSAMAQRGFDRPSAVVSAASLLGFVAAASGLWAAPVFAAPLLMLWALAPVVMNWLDQPTRTRGSVAALSQAEHHSLRQIALQTWRFFDELMTADNHFLPPDNLQVTLKLEVARRTSPTNIGLGILAWLAARDLGYISLDQMMERLQGAVGSLSQLESYHGHIYNWYRTDTLEPVYPRYISTVDSGNLMASLWTLRQGLLEQADQPLVPPEAALGWSELIEELRTRVPRLPETIMAEFAALASTAAAHRSDPAALTHGLAALVAVIRARETELREAIGDTNRFLVDRLIRQADVWHQTLTNYLEWYQVLTSPPGEVSQLISPEFADRCAAWASRLPSLGELAAGQPEPPLVIGEAKPVLAWWAKLETARRRAVKQAGLALAQVQALADQAGELANRTDMRFLYHPRRKVFHVGYNFDDKTFDRSFYDLLASEARISSFAAVAAGQVPAEHWWALGRNTRLCDGQPVLLSWSGTMFEYLLPRLFMREYPDTLLQAGTRAAVSIQRQYASRLEIPWGMSEAAHSALDYDNTYQYRAFGVPALGIQSGLEQGIVVAPYASFLALAYDPAAALANLRLLEKLGLRGQMGFFEAVDYRRAVAVSGERGVGVYTYMAHHQGMTMLSITNALMGDIFVDRFHRDLRVRAARTLLHERGARPDKSKQDVSLRSAGPLRPLAAKPVLQGTSSIVDPLPKAHILTNGNYSVMVTATGSGFSRWHGAELGRWTADPLRDEKGAYLYVYDRTAEQLWSTAFQPTLFDDPSYRVSFMPEKAVFERTMHGIQSTQEIYVAPDHDVEIRRVTLQNHSGTPRELETTSVMEFGLVSHDAWRAHPSFNKFFVGVELLPEQDGILAHRRPRSANDQPIWTAHLFVNLSQPANRARLQSDREQFLGRTSTPRRPRGLTSTVTPVPPQYPLDPMAAVTQTVSLAAGETVQLVALTIAASTRDEVIRLANRYRQWPSLARSRQVAWTLRQAELQRLQITEAEAAVFQHLAPYLLYPNSYLKAAARGLVAEGETSVVARDELPSGPLMVAALDDTGDLMLARQLGLAQKYYASRGLHYPLVLLIKLTGAPAERLRRLLEDLAESLKWLGDAEVEPDIHIWSLTNLSEGVFDELVRRARLVLDGADGPLMSQLETVAPLARGLERPPLLLSAPTPVVLPAQVEFPNGYGAFTDHGRSYSIAVTPETVTPAPWVNVLANPDFGSLITERGGGFTWSANSQEYRLTPWRNEPLSDRPTELIYVHDLETGRVWSPEPDWHDGAGALVSHSPGLSTFEGEYDGLRYSFTIFVPTGWKGPSSVRIQRLSLRNTTTKSHRLRFTAYVTWVLGTDREQWQEQVVTAWNDTDQILTATNPALSLYRTMAFMAHSEPVLDFTADRAEFWGPVRADTLPHGLAAAELSGRIGFGLDPGGVLRSEIEVPAGAEVAVEWYLGTADTPKAVASAVRALRKPSATTQALRATTGWWGDTLSALTAETPSRDTDILLNSWLLYQVLAGRIWGRTGYYQSSGAFGFRDQLQDSMALVYSRPDLTRSLIIQAAEHEFAQGDVQHWWMPGGLRGLRSRISDDRLWLPYVVSHYVNVTGDRGILGAMVPYLEEAPLAPGEPERFDAAKETRLERSLLDHCLRTIQISLTRGAHGLPLMGAGDWNDGYNLVGGAGKGESVWLGWFEVVVLRQMADLLDAIGHDPKLAKQYRSAAAGYTQALDEHAWDGEWYLRAFYDDGRTLGSARDPEDQIDSLPQSWAVIAGTGDAARRAQAVSAAVDRLVDRESKLVRLFTPAFDTSDRNPGYVKGYLPGIRENGGQYTHGSLWLTIALARLGRGDDAVELLRLMSPVNHSLDRDSANLYRLEPYVTAGDIYELPGQEGRGGWSWYTGSAAWMYRIWIEEVLGFQLRGHQLTINPCIDRNWPGFKLTYRFGKSVYTIEVTNPHGVCRGVAEQHLDGQPLPAGPVPLVDDGRPHHLEIRLGY